MKAGEFTAEQMVRILRQAESGEKTIRDHKVASILEVLQLYGTAVAALDSQNG